MEIFDIAGRIVLKQTLANGGSVAVEHLKQGSYFVRLSIENSNVITARLMIR